MKYQKDHLTNIVNDISQSLQHVYEYEIRESESSFWFYKMIDITLQTGQKTEWSIYRSKTEEEFAFEFILREKELEQKEKAQEEIMILYLLMIQTIETYFKKDAEIRMISLFQEVKFLNDAKDQIKEILQPKQTAPKLKK